MFQLGHIITGTQLIKNLSKVGKYLDSNPEPILIAQKNGQMLVLITAEMFEDLSVANLSKSGIEPPTACLRYMLEKKYL